MKFTRLNIGQWFTLLAGITIITIQIIKYSTGKLDLTYEEFFVTAVGLGLMFRARQLGEVLHKGLSKKVEGGDNE